MTQTAGAKPLRRTGASPALCDGREGCAALWGRGGRPSRPGTHGPRQLITAGTITTSQSNYTPIFKKRSHKRKVLMTPKDWMTRKISPGILLLHNVKIILTQSLFSGRKTR